MAVDETGLSDRQRKAIALLVEGRKLVDVAQEVGVSRQRLWEWRRQPLFRAELDEFQADVMRDVKLYLVRLGLTACQCLENAMEGDEAAQKGVPAAREVLDRLGASFAAPVDHEDATLTVRLAPATTETS